MSDDQEEEMLAVALRSYMAVRADKICERCSRRYDEHETIVVASGITEEDFPRCAAFTFDTATGEVAFAPCDKQEVLH